MIEPDAEAVLTVVLVAHRGRVRALLLSLQPRLSLQEVVFAVLANLALVETPGPGAAPAPLPEYDCCELYHVVMRARQNLLQWLPPLHLALEDLRLVQARVRGDPGILALFLVAEARVAQLRYVHALAQPGGPGLDAAPEASALCRDLLYAVADLEGRTRVHSAPADLLQGPPGDPVQAICRTLRGLHPLPWVLPMDVLAHHYGAFLREINVRGPFFVRLVHAPPITPAAGQEPRRPIFRRQFLEAGVFVPADSLLYALLQPLLVPARLLHRLAVAARLAVAWPQLLSPDLVFAVRVSPVAFLLNTLSAFWTMWILYLFQVVSVPSVSALSALYRRTYVVSLALKILVYGTLNLLPPAPIVEFIKAADPLGTENLFFHAFFDDLFRESAPRRAFGGYSRVLQAPEVFRFLRDAQIEVPPLHRRPPAQRLTHFAFLLVATLLPGFDPQGRA